MCVLMLRGPQTVGEIRGRTGRLYEFAELREVEETLDALARRDEPLVLKLPRQPGRKDARYTHLLSGTPAFEESSDENAAHASTRPSSSTRAADGERVARLEAEVAELRGEVAELRRQLEEFRKQFE